MQVSGQIKFVLPTEEGQSERGHWSRRTIVIEYGDEFPRLMAVTFFGDEKAKFVDPMQVGDRVQLVVHVESRDTGSRWFTDVRCSRVVGHWRKGGVQ